MIRLIMNFKQLSCFTKTILVRSRKPSNRSADHARIYGAEGMLLVNTWWLRGRIVEAKRYSLKGITDASVTKQSAGFFSVLAC